MERSRPRESLHHPISCCPRQFFCYAAPLVRTASPGRFTAILPPLTLTGTHHVAVFEQFFPAPGAAPGSVLFIEDFRCVISRSWVAGQPAPCAESGWHGQ